MKKYDTILLVFNKFKSKSYKIFKLFLVLFAFFLTLELAYVILRSFNSKLDLSRTSFFFLYLDNIFLNLGFIGAIGVFFSLYSSKLSKKLSLTLVSWIIFTFLFASLLIYFEWILNFGKVPEDFFNENPVLIWFDRIWFYSIPPICILASIGIYNLTKKVKNNKFLIKRKSYQSILKAISFSSLIILSFSGIIITGLNYGNANYRYSDARIETLGWISENIPKHEGILVLDNFFMGVGIDSITFVRQFFFDDIFDEPYNETLYLQRFDFLKTKNIKYAHTSQLHISLFPNISAFINDSLISKFYNETVYQNGDLTVYYAPYFN